MGTETAIKTMLGMFVVAVGVMVFSFAFINWNAISSAVTGFTDTVSITTHKPEAEAAEKRLLDASDSVARQSEAFLKSLPGSH